MVAMPKRPIAFPFGGRSDSEALYEQPGFTTKSAQNVRGRDCLTGRVRGAQRAGMTKYCPTVLGAGKVKALCSTALDDRKVAYSYSPGGEDEIWSAPTPTKTACRAGVTDRQGNVYVVDGNAGLAKFNSAGRLLMKVALPVADQAHVVRALYVDEADRIFAGVSSGGNVETAKVFCILQRPQPGQVAADDPNQYFVLWELTPGAYTEQLKVYRGSQLFAAHNYPQENRARVLVYEGLGLEPSEVGRLETVPYPVHGMDVVDGAVYTTAPQGELPASTFTIYQRIGYPGQRGFHTPIEGWTPLDLEDARKRIWSWYDARSLDETDLEQTGDVAGIESGQQVLRWRDLSGNGRHWFAGSLDLGGADPDEKGPTYLKNGPGGLPAITFRNDASHKQSMVTLGNASIAKSLADQQRTAIPQYVGGMWAWFILIRPTQDADPVALTPRLVFYADNEHASASDHALWVNRACGATQPGTLAAGTASYFATTDNVDDGDCATADQSLAFDFALWDSVVNLGARNGCVLVTVLWDGQVDPNDDSASKTRCLVRYNGYPVDRFEGLPLESLQPNRLAYAGNTIATAVARRFNGEVCAMLTLDRRNRYDDTTEPKVCTFDALETSSADADQTDTEIARIEAYFMYGRGLGRTLPPNTGGFPHFYGFTTLSGSQANGGPPAPTVGGLSTPLSNLLLNVPCAAKHDLGTGVLQWVCNEYTHPDTGANRGGIGHAVTARRVESDGKLHVWLSGPPSEQSTAGDVDVRKIIDNGTSFSGAQADGAWRHKFAGGAENGYAYPRLASDKFGNLFFPGQNLGGGTIRPLHVFGKDPDGSGDADEITTFLFPSDGSLAYGVALPPDALTPDYRTDLPSGPAEVVYAFTAAEEPASQEFDSVHKVQLVTTSSQTTGSHQTTVTLGVVDDDIKLLDEVGVTVPSGGSGAVDAASQYVTAFQADREIVVMDGLAYKVYSPLTGLVTALEATSAGELPPRAKLGCMWRHRLLLGRFADKPGRYCASAVGDIRDFDFRREPRIATMAFDASLTRAGEVEDSIVGFAPASDDLLFVLGTSRILRLTGDPMAGGVIDKVSDDLGGTFGRAWCKDKKGRVFIWGNPPGLYLLPEQGTEIQDLTEFTLQDTEFAEIDYSTHRIELAWDPIQKGVVIAQVAHGAALATARCWFWEEKTHRLVQGGALWPDVYSVLGKQPSAFSYLAGDTTRALLVGCEDGYVRMIDPQAADDDGSAIDSFVVLGPLNDIGALIEQKLVSTQVVLADDQQGCRLELFAGEEAESIGPILQATDLRPGLNDPFRKRVRGNYLWARLRSALPGRRWAMERGEVVIEGTAVSKNRST